MTQYAFTILKDRCITTSIENGADGKISTLPQVNIVNILGFQFLGIVSFEHVLPDDWKIYVH